MQPRYLVAGEWWNRNCADEVS